jgi:hypothetical protein
MFTKLVNGQDSALGARQSDQHHRRAVMIMSAEIAAVTIVMIDSRIPGGVEQLGG